MKAPAKSPFRIDPTGRLDVALYRLCTEHVLPLIEQRTGLQGLAAQLAPYAEAMIADTIPARSILPNPPKPRRRLC